MYLKVVQINMQLKVVKLPHCEELDIDTIQDRLADMTSRSSLVQERPSLILKMQELVKKAEMM